MNAKRLLGAVQKAAPRVGKGALALLTAEALATLTAVWWAIRRDNDMRVDEWARDLVERVCRGDEDHLA